MQRREIILLDKTPEPSEEQEESAPKRQRTSPRRSNQSSGRPRSKVNAGAAATRSSRPKGVASQATSRSGQAEEAEAEETVGAEVSERPRSEATASTGSSRPEGIVLQAMPRSGQAGYTRADELDTALRPRAEVDAIAAAASSSRPEGAVLQAATRSGHAEGVGSDERLLSASGVQTRSDIAEATETVYVRVDTTGSDEGLLSARGVQTRSDTAEATEAVPVPTVATMVPISGYGTRARTSGQVQWGALINRQRRRELTPPRLRSPSPTL